MFSDSDRVDFFLQMLNEVCNGFRVPDFEGTIGIREDEAEFLQGKLKGGVAIAMLSNREISALNQATILTLYELEDGRHEFQTRTGFALKEARAMVELLGNIETGDRTWES